MKARKVTLKHLLVIQLLAFCITSRWFGLNVNGKSVDQNPHDKETATKALVNSTVHQGCHEYVSFKSLSEKWHGFWHRRGGRPMLAYRMAVLAAMSYWEWHKWEIPQDTTGFGLIKHKKRSFSPRCILHRLRDFLFDALTRGNAELATSLDSIHHLNESNRLMYPRCNVTTSRDNKSTRMDNKFFTFEYWMYNWHEPSGPGVSFHDTDILVSTTNNGKTLAITFAGTASTADAITNIQTFEPANHSSFFQHHKSNHSVQGSIHRGFLNAYSRVSRGFVLRLNKKESAKRSSLDNLHKKFGHCTGDSKNRKKKRGHSRRNGDDDEDEFQDNTKINNENIFDDNAADLRLDSAALGSVKERKAGGCRSVGNNLVVDIRNLISDALSRRQTVHLVGHSLGGGLATLSALDIIVNFPEVPVSRLHLWTFGAPQIADDVFLQSAIQAAPRLKKFLQRNGNNGRFHRFVTLSDACQVDLVAVVTEKALNTRNRKLHRKAARRLGGVHGNVVHFADPKFLLTPEQYSYSNFSVDDSENRKRGTTHSAVAAHALCNYLNGISRESKSHPLQTDLPPELVDWIFK